MYEHWPRLDEIGEYAKIDCDHMKVEASRFDRTTVWHVQVPTLWGEFVLGASAFGVTSVFFPGAGEFDILDRADHYGWGLSSWGKKQAIEAGLELMGYTVGEVKVFASPCDLSYLTRFQQDVLFALKSIPFGETITIAELAELSGHRGKFAPVANVVKHNPAPFFIPCHRVLPTRGGIGNWCGPSGWKGHILEHEGVEVEDPTA